MWIAYTIGFWSHGIALCIASIPCIYVIVSEDLLFTISKSCLCISNISRDLHASPCISNAFLVALAQLSKSKVKSSIAIHISHEYCTKIEKLSTKASQPAEKTMQQNRATATSNKAKNK